MVRRILRSMYAVGIDGWEAGRPGAPDDTAAHHEIALEGARQGIVLLENDGILPLATARARGSRSSAATPTWACPSAPARARSLPAGRLRGRGPHRRPGDHGQHAQPVPAALVAGAGARARSCPRREIEFDPGMTPGRGGAAGRALGRGDRLRHPGRGRGLRPARPVAAVGAGRGHRGRRLGQPQHDRRARDRQPRRHAVAREGPRDRPGLVPGPGRRPGDRRGPHRRGQPVGPAAGELPGRPRPDAAPRAAGPRHAVGDAHHDRLRRGRRGRLPLVRAAGAGAAVRLRPRPGLHELRVRRPRGRRGRHRHGDLHRHQHGRARRAPTCPSST